MQQASLAGDLSAILRLIQKTSKLPVQEFIKKTCGSLLYMYYTYVKQLHVVPVDLDDLIDGLLYLDAYHYAVKDTYNG
jgi:hypothetical protein